MICSTAPAARRGIGVDGGVDTATPAASWPPARDDPGGGQALFGSRTCPQAIGAATCARPHGRRGSDGRASSSSTVRVRYAETDKMGVVYYANYFVWFEVARADLLRTLGWSYREMEHSGVSLPVIEAHCEYRQPAQVRRRAGSEYGRAGCCRRSGWSSPTRCVRLADGGSGGDRADRACGARRDGRPCRLPARVREVFA